MPSGDIIYKGNDNLLEIDLLTNDATGAFINAATVTVTLVDVEGSEVAGQSWPTTLSYVSASDGKYRATLQDVLTLTASDIYTAKITADGGPGLLAYFELGLVVKIRTHT